MTTHSPASPSWEASRTDTGRPTIRGMAHHTARYQTPTQAPTNGPKRNSPTQVTGCSQLSRTVQATACAAKSVPAYSLRDGRR